MSVNPLVVQQIAAELFMPALQQAVIQAKEQGCAKEDVLYALGNAYLTLITRFIGDQTNTETFLQRQLDYLRAQSDAPAPQPISG
ncbi:hypothetical protein [Thiobaca trueperi]|uniref:Uncharacterized protein n=1 Tax=Thiobaca trueperi TaxID=127458 RepID=A0A4R3N1F1_9GAMM|nr:hypothetical protein [Thiobaca trueperi]TCT22878.1 hypothetical protein EDC35_102209 [Thiobaca trueperi]